MACTVAVEESISEHYNSQIRALMEVDPERYTELLKVSQLLISLYLRSTEYFPPTTRRKTICIYSNLTQVTTV